METVGMDKEEEGDGGKRGEGDGGVIRAITVKEGHSHPPEPRLSTHTSHGRQFMVLVTTPAFSLLPYMPL